MNQLSQKTFAITPEMGKALGDARKDMIPLLNRFRIKTLLLLQPLSLGYEKLELRRLPDERYDGSDDAGGQGGQGGMMSLMPQMQQLSQQQNGLNQMSQSFNGLAGSTHPSAASTNARLAQHRSWLESLSNNSIRKLVIWS
jgi:hypothetical protein